MDNKTKVQKIKIYSTPVSAGFPSPAEDFSERKMDLNEHVIKHPAATYFVRAKGTSMQNAGIGDGDILVVDKSLEVHSGQIIIASIDGEFTVKRVIAKNGKLFLQPENENYKPIPITESDDFQIFGVVTYVIKKIV